MWNLASTETVWFQLGRISESGDQPRVGARLPFPVFTYVTRLERRDAEELVARRGLQAGSWPTAKAASATIESGPVAHMPARNMARADSNEAVPLAGAMSNEAASTTAAQRSALVGSPVSTPSQQASTASGG